MNGGDPLRRGASVWALLPGANLRGSPGWSPQLGGAQSGPRLWTAGLPPERQVEEHGCLIASFGLLRSSWWPSTVCAQWECGKLGGSNCRLRRCFSHVVGLPVLPAGAIVWSQTEHTSRPQECRWAGGCNQPLFNKLHIHKCLCVTVIARCPSGIYGKMHKLCVCHVYLALVSQNVWEHCWHVLLLF